MGGARTDDSEGAGWVFCPAGGRSIENGVSEPVHREVAFLDSKPRSPLVDAELLELAGFVKGVTAGSVPFAFL